MAPRNRPVRTHRNKATRFVLFVGDEGAILVHMQGKKVLRRMFAAGPEPTNSRNFQETLASDPHAPIRILIDMQDQSYVRQTLPPVTQLSVNKLIKRRLDRDFSPDDIKGAVVLGREKGGRRDWNFMMISLANTPTLSKWIEMATERPNPFQGIYLLPLESESYVKKLIDGLRQEASGSQWRLLVSHNKVSGFRQVVLNNGKMIFSRMAQTIGESLPDVIAGNIEQEILNTTEYLKRLGYQDETGLDVYIVVSEDIKKVIDPKKIKARNVNTLTPYEAANALDLEQAAQPEDHFGDVVCAAFFGTQRKPLLRLDTRYSKQLRLLQTGIFSIRAAAAVAASAIVLYALSGLWDTFDVRNAIDTLETRQSAIRRELAETQEEAKKLPHNIDRITDIVSLHEMFSKDSVKPLWFIRKFYPFLQKDALAQSINWTLNEPPPSPDGTDNRQINAELSLEFTNPPQQKEAYAKMAQAFFDRISTAFDGYTVTHSDLPGMINENESFQATFGGETANAPPPPVNNAQQTVRVTVSGPTPAPLTPQAN